LRDSARGTLASRPLIFLTSRSVGGDRLGRSHVDQMANPTGGFGRSTVLAAIEAIKAGKIVCVTDDESRENEGDLIMAAEFATPETIAFFIRYTSGVICVSVRPRRLCVSGSCELPSVPCAQYTPEQPHGRRPQVADERLQELNLPPMYQNNEDPKQTAFTVSTDVKHGTTTGISAADRAATFRALANPKSQATDFNRPGHVFPLRPRAVRAAGARLRSAAPHRLLVRWRDHRTAIANGSSLSLRGTDRRRFFARRRAACSSATATRRRRSTLPSSPAACRAACSPRCATTTARWRACPTSSLSARRTSWCSPPSPT
jgi:3,4-dihydroxy-2-butanone 4-phosphate synthase